MTLELLVFIASVLFGVLLYWRESHSNKMYRFFNKLMYSKKLQMSPENKTGFLYQQKFVLRLVFITLFFLVFIVLLRLVIPIDLATISLFVSCIAGTLIGTYIAGLIKKTNATDTINPSHAKPLDEIQTQTPTETTLQTKEKTTDTAAEEKTARERLKEKGLL